MAWPTRIKKTSVGHERLGDLRGDRDSPRSISRRLAVLRGGAANDTRRKAGDPYGLRTPAARKAASAFEAGLIEAARDDTLEWSAWVLVHLAKVPAMQAARKLGILLPE